MGHLEIILDVFFTLLNLHDNFSGDVMEAIIYSSRPLMFVRSIKGTIHLLSPFNWLSGGVGIIQCRSVSEQWIMLFSNDFY